MSGKPREPGSNAAMAFNPVSGIEGYAAAAIDVLGAARHDLALVSVELDRRLFGTEAFTDALRHFILQHRRARLRVLLHEPASAVRNSIRLIEFARMVSSRIEFRTVPEDRRRQREEFLIADERALLYRSAPEQLDAKLYPDAPMVARSHLRAFEAVWHESSLCREVSTLGL